MINANADGTLRVMPVGYKPKADIILDDTTLDSGSDNIDSYKGTRAPKGGGMFGATHKTGVSV